MKNSDFLHLLFRFFAVQSRISIGGQAVIEGVMMRSPKSFVVAVRRPDGQIVVREQSWETLLGGVKFLRWPFFRGAIVLIESLWNGMSALNFSAEQAMPDVNSSALPSEAVGDEEAFKEGISEKKGAADGADSDREKTLKVPASASEISSQNASSPGLAGVSVGGDSEWMKTVSSEGNSASKTENFTLENVGQEPSASRTTESVGILSTNGKLTNGDSIKGESIKGESIKSDSIEGESIEGESIKGESIKGDLKKAESTKREEATYEGSAPRVATKTEKIFMGITMACSIALGMALFVALPHILTWLFGEGTGLNLPVDGMAFHLVDGIFKAMVFIAYLGAISLMEDIRRVFQYHGAEHKSIWTYECGRPLIPTEAKSFTTLHPRCGTAFILIVLLVSIVLFAAIFPFVPQISSNRFLNQLGLIAVKLPLMFPVAGIAYELQRLSAKESCPRLIKALLMPGLWMQKITTKEPTEAQLEVALVSIRRALGREHGVLAGPPEVRLYKDFEDAVAFESVASATNEAPDTERR